MRITKPILFIAFLLLLLIVTVYLQISIKAPTPQKINNKILVAPSPVQKLQVTRTNLTDRPFGVAEFVKIEFNKPVLGRGVHLEITPDTGINYQLNQSGTELTIEPKNAWNFDTIYTLKLPRATFSQDDEPLDKDYEFTFTTIKFGGI